MHTPHTPRCCQGKGWHRTQPAGTETVTVTRPQLGAAAQPSCAFSVSHRTLPARASSVSLRTPSAGPRWPRWPRGCPEAARPSTCSVCDSLSPPSTASVPVHKDRGLGCPAGPRRQHAMEQRSWCAGPAGADRQGAASRTGLRRTRDQRARSPRLFPAIPVQA